MEVTARQRTKINAALCLIHDNGYDASPVIKLANELMKDVDTRTAYQLALNDFLSNVPDLAPVVSKVLNLVDASDDTTVDQYDTALSEYVTSGDDSTLKALAPMIAEDSLALALQKGDITPEEAANGDMAKALGFEPGPALQEAVAARAEKSSNQQPESGQEQAQPPQPNQPMWQPRGQLAVPQLGEAPAPQPFINGSQVSLCGGPTGFVAMGARAKIARETGPPTAPAGEAAHSA